jgi:RNA polymerase sigma factor (sigma-70 family)
VSIAFEVPEKTLAAKEEGREARGVMKNAFTELERQFEAYRAGQRGEQDWKRLTRREEIRRKKIEALPDTGDRESFFSLVEPHLDALEEFARHMIAYAEARSDLVSGELTADELVDATLLRAYREFVKDPARGEIKRWLIQLAADELAGKIKQSRWERKHTVYVEERVPETPQAEEVSTLGEETLYFYQPDEALKVEDVIPDLTVPSPEEETERKELRQCVREALATMSREWRRALLLRYVNGLTGTKLAKAIGTTESEVERVIEYAREYLRHSLIQSGCSFQTT